jgi:1-aminocyclopropane-1-carboxylate deaminase
MNDIASFYQCTFSALQEIQPHIFKQQNLRLFIKRDDLLHPYISGNKWRKLKYNLLEARRLGYRRLITFGGAYSNHLAAVAAAGREFGFSTMGVVRGERVLPLNPTMKYVEECGMNLVYVSRANFKKKSNIFTSEGIKINADDHFFIPEGGSGCFALPGVAEMVAEVGEQLGDAPDYMAVACGTGGTLAGTVSGLNGLGTALGVSVLKGDFLQNDVKCLLGNCGQPVWHNWQVRTDYHFSGYAKFTPSLISFINQFYKDFGIRLDPVYTGKLFFAVFDLAEKNYFREGSTIVLVHSGGLQGIAGFNERFGNLII